MFSDLLPREWLIAAAAVGGMLLVVLVVTFGSARWSERRSAQVARRLAVTQGPAPAMPTQRRPLTAGELQRLNALYESGSISQYDYARLRSATEADQLPSAD